MTRNVTLRLDEALLKRCKRAAVAQEKSLSQWVADVIKETLARDAAYARARKRALERLARGWPLGGHALTREEAHER